MLLLGYKHSQAVSGASPQSYALMSLGREQAENGIPIIRASINLFSAFSCGETQHGSVFSDRGHGGYPVLIDCGDGTDLEELAGSVPHAHDDL